MRAARETKEPIKITWTDLNYSVEVALPKSNDPNAPKTMIRKVLQNCSGYALPGQTLYIMGASGAGKTSLLNAISDRISLPKGSSLTGMRTLNDKLPLTAKLFGSCSVYVMQDDVIFSCFTVKEALTFAARLKLKIPIAE
jgi:ABC-type multidrug transport system ATPase subunit